MNKAQPESRTGVAEQAKVRKKGQWLETWMRFRRDKVAMAGVIVLLFLILVAIFADRIAPYNYETQDLAQRLKLPSATHIFGTDNLGRDILSRIIYGARVSLLVGVFAVTISTMIGGTLGTIGGYFGGRLDNFIMRCIDVILSIPSLLLAISVAATLGPGLLNAMIAVGISGIGGFARIARSSVLSVRKQEYIEAARAMNASDARIIVRHILPNIMAPLIVQFTLGVANGILSASSLSFIGLGVQPPIPEWGAMLAGGRQYLRDYWHIVVFPGLAILVTVYALNVMGDGLRDALDPRLKN
jgi:peptide/nickel transport system permease protein